MIRLIIPAYNEARPLRSLLPRLPPTLGGHAVAPLVVSDGSTDSTVEVAGAAGMDVLALEPNRGKAAATSAALREIADDHHEIVVIMDGDGQHDPDDLPRLVQPLLDRTADLVLGSRYAEDERRGVTPLNRYLVRRTTIAVLERMLETRFSDPYCGFRAFSRAAMDQIEWSGDRYEAELEILFSACRRGLEVVEVPIRRIYGPDTSKMSTRGGPMLGRVLVVNQYARTILRNRRPPGRLPSRRVPAARSRRSP